MLQESEDIFLLEDKIPDGDEYSEFQEERYALVPFEDYLRLVDTDDRTRTASYSDIEELEKDLKEFTIDEILSSLCEEPGQVHGLEEDEYARVYSNISKDFVAIDLVNSDGCISVRDMGNLVDVTEINNRRYPMMFDPRMM